MKFTLVTICFLFSIACSSATKAAPQKHYQVTGKVVSVDAQDQTASIDAAAVPGYMEAMTMDYPIESKSELGSLHPGDHITATLDVNGDGTYALSHIKLQTPAAK